MFDGHLLVDLLINFLIKLHISELMILESLLESGQLILLLKLSLQCHLGLSKEPQNVSSVLLGQVVATKLDLLGVRCELVLNSSIDISMIVNLPFGVHNHRAEFTTFTLLLESIGRILVHNNVLMLSK